jgi:membrane protein
MDMTRKAALPRILLNLAKGRRLPLGLAPWLALGLVLAAWPKRLAPGDRTSRLALLEPGRGRRANSPAQIPPAGWKDVLWRTWREFNADHITRVAGGVSFFIMLALFPGLAAFVSLYGMLGDVGAAEAQLAALTGVLPADALTFIGDEMVRIAAERQASLSATFVGGALLSIWSANAGMKALMEGLDVAYEEDEKRSFIRFNLISLAFTVGALVALSGAILALVGLPLALDFLRLDPASRLLALLRWPALLALAMLAMGVLYRFGPSRQHARWRWVTWGGAGAAVLWLGVSLLFSWYVGNVAHYSVTYGSLGAIIGFMTWIWLSVIVILAGAELNAELEHQTSVDSTTGPPLPMGLRGAAVADSLGASRPAAWGRLAKARARAAFRRLSRSRG